MSAEMVIEVNPSELLEGLRLGRELLAGAQTTLYPIYAYSRIGWGDGGMFVESGAADSGVLCGLESARPPEGSAGEFMAWMAQRRGFLLPRDEAVEWLATLPRDASVVQVRAIDSRVSLAFGADEIELLCVPAEDYPRAQKVDQDGAWTVSAGNLSGLVEGMVYALPREDARRVLLGICLESQPGEQVRLTATDGKALARVVSRDGVASGSAVRVVAPRVMMATVAKHASADLVIGMSSTQMSAQWGLVRVWSQTLEGKYPDCDAVIPRDWAGSVEFDSVALVRALKRVAVTVSATKGPLGSVVMRRDGDRLALWTSSHDRGESTALVPAVFGGAGLTELAFSIKILQDTLASISSERVVMRWKTNTAPTFWGPANAGAGPDWTRIVMPVKMSEVAGAVAAGGEGE